jgi:tetratricopeptide (TPR) repeat protein
VSIAHASADLRRKFAPEGLGFARLGEALLREKKTDEALQVLTQGVKRHPGYLTGFLLLGRACRTMGLLSEAKAGFESALRLDDRCPAARVALTALGEESSSGMATPARIEVQSSAVITVEIDEYDEFQEDEGVESPPDIATVTLAEIYLQQGLKEQALQIYRQLLERQPDNEAVKKRLREIET